MGFYKQRENFLKNLAIGHPLVQHNAPAGVDDTTPRRSFYRINDEEELASARQYWAHFPCVVQMSLSGGDKNKDGNIKQGNENAWLFLTTVNPDSSNPIEASAITDAYDTTFDVMQDFKKSVLDIYEADDSCAVIQRPSNFKWEQYQLMELVGWLLVFNDETKAFL